MIFRCRSLRRFFVNLGNQQFFNFFAGIIQQRFIFTVTVFIRCLIMGILTVGGKYLNDCTLYVTLEPCVMCAGAAGWTQLGRLVYGADDPKRGFERIGREILHPRTEVISGVLADECEALMKTFFKSRR